MRGGGLGVVGVSMKVWGYFKRIFCDGVVRGRVGDE